MTNRYRHGEKLFVKCTSDIICHHNITTVVTNPQFDLTAWIGQGKKIWDTAIICCNIITIKDQTLLYVCVIHDIAASPRAQPEWPVRP